MGLLQKLKSVLGLNGTQSSGSGRSDDVDVTVEREPSTESEDAVKGTETATSGNSVESDDDGPATASDVEDADTDDAASTPGAGAPDTDDGDAETDATDAETDAADAETDAADAETDAADAETDAADAETDAADAETDEAAVEGSTDPVTELTGIGPAYGDRLAGAGIETVGELAAADPADVAADTDLGESRVAGWVEQAKSY